jgi:hypothetical protein
MKRKFWDSDGHELIKGFDMWLLKENELLFVCHGNPFDSLTCDVEIALDYKPRKK